MIYVERTLSYLLFIFYLSPLKSFCQDTISYNNILIDTIYNVSYGYECNDDKCKYHVNNKRVFKEKYLSYKPNFNEKLEGVNEYCAPCITRYFDIDRNLISEGEYYKGNHVGYYNEFYKNGNLKISGRYKTLPSFLPKNHSNFFNIKDCIWSYFKKDGTKLYDEFWKDDSFLRQTPEQKKPEIWTYKLYLNDSLITNNRKVNLDEISKIKVVPFFKNSNHDYSQLSSFISIYISRFNKTIKIPHDSFSHNTYLEKYSLHLKYINKYTFKFFVEYNNEHIWGQSINFNF